MPEQVRFPYGNAFVIGTPHIDQLSNQMFDEHRRRMLYKQQRERALDDEFSKMLPGIRSADVPKLADLWQDYKADWIDLQRHPPKDQKEYLRRQRGLTQKKAAVFQHNAGSIETKDKEKGLLPQLNKDRTGQFKDEAYDIVSQGMKQPYDSKVQYIDPKTGEPQEIDWTDPDNLKRHIDVKGVMSGLLKAQGKPTERIGDKTKPSDLQMPKIKSGNNPYDFYSNSLLPASANQVDWLSTLPHPSQDEYNDKLIQWNGLDPAIKKMWGMKQELPAEDELRTPIERALKYQAMTYGLNPNNHPKVIGYVDDKEAKMKAANAEWDRREAHRDKDWFKKYTFRLDHPLPNNALFLSENTGNALDAMTDADFTGRNLIIKGGVFYNRDGTPKTGKVFITGDKLPTAVRSALKSGGVDPKYLISGVDGVVENGVLQNISNDLIGTVSRDDMEGVFQRKLDTEPLKGQRLKFAEKQNPPPKKTKTTKNPLGLDL